MQNYNQQIRQFKSLIFWGSSNYWSYRNVVCTFYCFLEIYWRKLDLYYSEKVRLFPLCHLYQCFMPLSRCYTKKYATCFWRAFGLAHLEGAMTHTLGTWPSWLRTCHGGLGLESHNTRVTTANARLVKTLNWPDRSDPSTCFAMFHHPAFFLLKTHPPR